jgi:hypothetical protein
MISDVGKSEDHECEVLVVVFGEDEDLLRQDG